MPRYIDADNYIAYLSERRDICKKYYDFDEAGDLQREINRIKDFPAAALRGNVLVDVTPQLEEAIEDVPAADVAPVVHGKWEPVETESDILFECSICECQISTNWHYDDDRMFSHCPCCGAKMDGGKDDG